MNNELKESSDEDEDTLANRTSKNKKKVIPSSSESEIDNASVPVEEVSYDKSQPDKPAKRRRKPLTKIILSESEPDDDGSDYVPPDSDSESDDGTSLCETTSERVDSLVENWHEPVLDDESIGKMKEL